MGRAGLRRWRVRGESKRRLALVFCFCLAARGTVAGWLRLARHAVVRREIRLDVVTAV